MVYVLRSYEVDVVKPLSVLCAEAATLAQRRVHRALTERLNGEQREKLERLIGPPSSGKSQQAGLAAYGN
jgi:hypothetical protein